MANVFAVPSAGKSFTLSLVDIQNSLQTLQTNFYGPSLPTSADIIIQGVATSPSAGMLYRSSLYKAFFVYDPTSVKGGSIGGNFTRVGIGNRNFENITELVSNISTIEQSEIVSTVGASANYRVYLRTDNSSGFVDIGTPAANSLTTAMFKTRQISNTFIAAKSITGFEIANFPEITGVKETCVTVPGGTTLTIDLYYGTSWFMELTNSISSVTVVNANPTATTSFILYTRGDGTQRTITWGGSFKFPSGQTPTPTATLNKIDIYTCIIPPTNFSASYLIQSGGQNF